MQDNTSCEAVSLVTVALNALDHQPDYGIKYRILYTAVRLQQLPCQDRRWAKRGTVTMSRLLADGETASFKYSAGFMPCRRDTGQEPT